jgi:hypothetical protein
MSGIHLNCDFTGVLSSHPVMVLEINKFLSVRIKLVNDERGIRTPEVKTTTGLAILRHTRLGYLVKWHLHCIIDI